MRNYNDEVLTLTEISQLLWAAGGITNQGDTGPRHLPAGIYRYRRQGHELEKVADGDVRAELCVAALDQECVEDAAAVLVLTAIYERTVRKYGKGGTVYAYGSGACGPECLFADGLPGSGDWGGFR